MKNLLLVSVASLLLCVGGCTSIPEASDEFEMKLVQTDNMTFRVWEKDGIVSGKPLRFYIEGDGNPNPSAPEALFLAERDPNQNIIYLTRPCQYVTQDVCANPDIYGKSRFHTEIIREMQELVAYHIKKYNAPSIEFVGYDGGAAIAVLLANKFPVTKIVTIAGILDEKQPTQHTKRGPITDMDVLNPFDNRNSISGIKQIHYVGGKDTVAPRQSAERFVHKMNNPVSAQVKVVPNMGHSGWYEIDLEY